MSDEISQAHTRNGHFLEKALIASGFVFSFASAGTLVYGVYLIFTTGAARRMFTDEKAITLTGLLATNIDIVAISVFAGILAWLGLGLFRRAGRSTNYVIRPEDRPHIWPLISEPNPVAIDQYIRLASLSGVSGAFTKVGFTGLPLATVALTVLFVLIGWLGANDEILELGKLTLGAFIGSFVQRQVERATPVGAAAPEGMRLQQERLPI